MYRFLGVCNWYSQFVINYVDMIALLIDCLKQGVKWVWVEVEQRAFDDIKSAFHDYPNLSLPDYKKPFYIQVDASEIGAGVVLFQRSNDPEKDELLYTRVNSSARCRKGTPQ